MSHPDLRTAVVVAVLIVVGVGLASLKALLPDHAGFGEPGFAVSFWSNFWSELFVTVPIAGGLAWLINWRKTAAAVIRGGYRRLIEGNVRVFFRISNTGQIAFRSEEIYFVVYCLGPVIPERLHFENLEHLDQTIEVTSRPEEPFQVLYKFSGKLTTPVFHGIEVRLFSFQATEQNLVASRFWFYLSTPYGVLPSGTEIDSTGLTTLEMLPRITLNIFPDESLALVQTD